MDKGHEVSVIAATTNENQVEKTTIQGINVYYIQTSDLGKKSLAATRFGYNGLQTVNQIQQNNSIDVLHMNAFPGLGAVLKPLPGKKSPDGVVADVRSLATSNRIFSLISKSVLNIQNKLVENMATIDPLMAKDIFGTSEDIDIIPLGADFDRFYPGKQEEIREKLGLDPNDIVFGYTGVLNEVRRIDTIIEAFAKINGTYPRAKLVIIGGGNDYDRLTQYASTLDCDEAVIFTGEVAFKQVPKYVRTFDIGISHIPDRRPFKIQPPIKTVEFLASGLPVIATATAGNERFVIDGENGILCPELSTEYANAMEKLINNPEEREEMAESSRSSVEEYDYKNIVSTNLLPLYNRIC
ncbi:glycosyltransferase family 4 protein [Haloarcula nitratireducens]|uniref:Glycosyltransferase family 4 protein n=1 Tax=Haloarcula nitratireducens TaxID=2487749 RepID=A0AAW4PGF0_9EURY|nr:glycosyltransferase family 4 protein [Halomicroarcula nitratireducens]MBX0296636.1 glycosyltransferase family 4 protein [Halomicroarcula nitratireducens]